MRRATILRFFALLLTAAFLLAPGAYAAGGKRAPRPKTAIKIPRSKPPVYKAKKQKRQKFKVAKEPRENKIKRNPAARREFQRANPCPANGKTSGRCPGYVVDHIRPLKRGGPDAPSNMQWQTKEAAKAKDRIE